MCTWFMVGDSEGISSFMCGGRLANARACPPKAEPGGSTHACWSAASRRDSPGASAGSKQAAALQMHRALPGRRNAAKPEAPLLLVLSRGAADEATRRAALRAAMAQS